jgi:MbtH protein
MANRFDKELEEEKKYVVLINDEGQYSLWPSFKTVPAGWTVVLQASRRQQCLDYVKEHWTDMRPKSLLDVKQGCATPKSAGHEANPLESPDVLEHFAPAGRKIV